LISATRTELIFAELAEDGNSKENVYGLKQKEG
jgi:hypothetical protein